MTASRTCRACGAPLDGNVRWCLRCYEPSRELTPRAPTWAPGEFVDAPIHTGGAVPHWSRWEKSPTTFGPVGRVCTSVLVVLWVLGAGSTSPITLIFLLPSAGVILRAVWARGWIVPGANAPDRPPIEPMSSWLWDRSELLRSAILALFVLVGVGLVMLTSDPVVRFVVIVTAVVVACFALFRKIDGSR